MTACQLELEPATYPAADSWVKAAQNRADITPGILAECAKSLMGRRRPGHTLVFVVDEVGRFVARDVQKMLDLQALVQGLGRVGRGKMWLVVTSQEKLTELVGGLDDRRVEVAPLSPCACAIVCRSSVCVTMSPLLEPVAGLPATRHTRVFLLE